MTRSGAALLLLLVSAAPAFGWRVDLRGGRLASEDLARSIAVLPDGDGVVVADLDCDPSVLRIDRATGDVVWRTEVAGVPYPCPVLPAPAAPVAVHGSDAVVVALGGLVVQLDAATGAERWRHEVVGYQFGAAVNAVVVDRAGGVVVAGHILGSDDGDPESDFLVASIDGAIGVERWRQVLAGTPGRPDPDDYYWGDTADDAVALALDAAGNLIVAGVVEQRGHPRWHLYQFAPDSGALRWRRRIKRQHVRLLAVDALRDEVVIAGGREDQRGIGVQRYAAAGGNRRWRRVVRGTRRAGGFPADLVVAPDGDAYLAASLRNAEGGVDAAIARLAAGDGLLRWSRALVEPERILSDPLDLDLDGAGNLVLAGRVLAAQGTSAPLLLGLDAGDGSERWRFAPSGSTPQETAIRGLASAEADVLVVGQTQDPGADADLLAARIAAADGSVAWERRIDGGAADGDDAGLAVATLAGGDVIAAGGLDNGAAYTDFAVLRLAGDSGAVRWRFEANGTREFFSSAYDLARQVTVDLHDDVVAAGFIEQAATDWDLAVVKLDGVTGIERWRSLVAGTAQDGRDLAADVVTDAAGDVVVVGQVVDRFGTSLTGWNFFVQKLDGASGMERWRRTVPLSYGQAFQVGLDAAGDVLVAGVVTGGFFAVVKLAGDTGADRWLASLEGAAHALAVAGDGDVVAAGLRATAGTAPDWTVVRVAGASGTERWRHVFDGAFHGSDVAETVALDAAGDVLVAGSVQAGPELWDTVLQKLDGATGDQRWRRTLSSDAAPVPSLPALAVAANGDALVTFAPSIGPAHSVLAVARLAGGDGAERWRRVVAGSAPGPDHGAAIAERADGAVVVAGRTANVGSGPDFTVATLSGSDGSDLPGAP